MENSSQACVSILPRCTNADEPNGEARMNTVRPARPEDSAAWLRMRCALWPEGSEREHATEIAVFFAGKAHMPLAVLLAFDHGNAVGFAELSIHSVAESCETNRVSGPRLGRGLRTVQLRDLGGEHQLVRPLLGAHAEVFPEPGRLQDDTLCREH